MFIYAKQSFASFINEKNVSEGKLRLKLLALLFILSSMTLSQETRY